MEIWVGAHPEWLLAAKGNSLRLLGSATAVKVIAGLGLTLRDPVLHTSYLQHGLTEVSHGIF